MRSAMMVTGLILLALMGWHSSVRAEESKLDKLEVEIAFWQAIQGSRDASDYEAYLKAFPNGQFLELAVNRLVTLKPGTPSPAIGNVIPLSPAMMDEDTLFKLDLAFWSTIQDSKDPEDYDVYLRKFPIGAFRELAEARRDALQP